MSKKRKAVVTGGAGFIGSHIAKRLIDEGWNVFVLDNLSTGLEENVPRCAELMKIDLSDEDVCSRLQSVDCDVALHLAGQSSGEISFRDPLYDLKSHVLSTFNMLEWCKLKSVPRFLYASSMAVYGDPDRVPVAEHDQAAPKTYYASAKLSAEAYIRFFNTRGVNGTIFRLFSVYGPGQNMKNKDQGMASIYLSYVLENKPIHVKGSPDRFRDLVYIDDVVDAWVKCIDAKVSYGKTYNVAKGKKVHVRDLLQEILAVVGRKDYPIVYDNTTLGDQFGIFGSADAIRGDVGWVAETELRDGLGAMYAWEQSREGRVTI